MKLRSPVSPRALRSFRRARLLGVASLLAAQAGCSAAPTDDSAAQSSGEELASAQVTRALTPAPVQYPTLLIVTDAVMEPALRPLVAHKNATGMPTLMVTPAYLRELLSPSQLASAEDEAAIIKMGIAWYYQSGHTKYVLLAGDETHVPTRYSGLVDNPTAPTTIGYRPTDLYYANLYDKATPGVITRWNGAGNGLYNEAAWGYSAYLFNPDNVDGYPELAIGRVAVNDPVSMSNYVEKVIAYETQAMPGARRLAAIEDEQYGSLASPGQARGMAQEIVTAFNMPTTYSALFPVTGTIPPSPWIPLDITGFNAVVEPAGWVGYVGHGNQWGFDNPANPPYFAVNTGWYTLFDQMTTGNMPIVMTGGCNTGLFTSYDPDGSTAPYGTPAPSPQPIPANFIGNAVLAASPTGGGMALMGDTIIGPPSHPAEFFADLGACDISVGGTLGDMYLCAQQAYWNKNYLDWTSASEQGDTLQEPRIYLGLMNLQGDPSLRVQQRSGAIATAAPFTQPAAESANTPCLPGEVCELADVDGDGYADVVAFAHGASPVVNVSFSYKTQFGPRRLMSSFFCQSSETCAVGDVDGDGKADIIAFSQGAGGAVWVSLATGADPFMSFGSPRQLASNFCTAGQTCKVADMNGDKKADIVSFASNGVVTFAASSVTASGGGFGAPTGSILGFCTSTTETCDVGDVDGDGNADAVEFTRGATPQAWVGLSNGVNFGAPQLWSTFFCQNGEVCELGDFNRDGNADLIAFTHGASPAVYVGFSTGEAFAPPQLEDSFFCQSTEGCAVGDVNGDYAADLVAFNPAPATWIAFAPAVIR